MKALSKNWLTEGLIDFEYKKYVLLAWLQGIDQYFTDSRLFPSFSELMEHYKSALEFQKSKSSLYNSFPKRLESGDINNLHLQYKSIVNEDITMQVIEETIQFALLEFGKYLTIGKTIYETVEKNLSISPIGLSTLNNTEGYLFLSFENSNEARVYQFKSTIFENADEKYRGIHVSYIDTLQKSYLNTYEKMKLDIIKRFHHLPNPAIFAIESKLMLPIEDTVLPLAKRMMMKYLASAA